MAIHIEEEGEKFYNLFSEKAFKDEVKKIFNFLALEERRHAETFKEIYKNLEKEEFLTAYEDEEANKYLHAWVSAQVFIDWDRILKEDTFFNSSSAIDLAISLEKDSLLFYYGILEHLKEKSKKIVREIINQERTHLEQLITLKKSF